MLPCAFPGPPDPRSSEGWPWSADVLPQFPTDLPHFRWPKISIVTPSYNQGEFLEETIRSVLLQGYPNLEYFIIDGGSTDQSVEIIRKYESYLTSWVSEKDGGQSDAIAKGFAQSSGEIFAWLNSDDLLAPGAVFTAALYLSKFKNIGMVYGDRCIIDENSRLISVRRYLPFVRWQLRFMSGIPQETAFWRSDIYREVGGIDSTLSFAMDYDLWWKLSGKTKFRHLPLVMGGWRMHDKAKTVLVDKSSGENAVIEKMSLEFNCIQSIFLGKETSLIQRKILFYIHKKLLEIYINIGFMKRDLEKCCVFMKKNKMFSIYSSLIKPFVG